MKQKRFTKILLITVAVLTILTAIFVNASADEPDGSSPEKISLFLKENGYSVSNPVTKEITIPTEFSDVYTSYNTIQKEQGFDLSRHKGKAAVLYTFSVIGYINEEGKREDYVEAHVIVCDGKIIGGDIASTKLDGFMKGIRG